MGYQTQLDNKLALVRSTFERARLEGFDCQRIQSIKPSPESANYRNRVKLVPFVIDHGSPAVDSMVTGRQTAASRFIGLGLYKEGSHEVVDIPNCPVQMVGINQAIEQLRRLLLEFETTIYGSGAADGQLRYVTVRQSLASGAVLVGLVTKTDELDRGTDLAEQLMARTQEIVGVVQNVNSDDGNAVFGTESRTLAGQDYLEEQVAGVGVHLGIASFFQVNTRVAEAAYYAILSGLSPGPEDVLLDLYAGVGAVGLVCASRVKRVIGVEEVAEAVRLAHQAAKSQSISNVEFRKGRVEDLLPEVSRAGQLIKDGGSGRGGSSGGGRMHVVINPPRRGVDRLVMTSLLRARPDRVAYLSCDPTTLVRDLRYLMDGGYRIRQVQPFDMFPQTDKVETLVILETSPGRSESPLRRRPGRGSPYG